MKDFKEEHIDPEQYWPGAEKLLEGHYTAKRRRRAAVLLGAVLVGLLSVYLINYEKINFVEKSKSDRKIIVKEVSEENKISVPNESETITISKEIEESKIEGVIANQNSIVESQKEIVAISPQNQVSTDKIETQKTVVKKEKNNMAVSVASSQHASSEVPNSSHAITSTTPSNQANQTYQADPSNQVNQNIASNQQEPSRNDQKYESDESPSIKSNFEDVEYISAMPLLTWKKTPFEEVSIQPDNRPVLQNKKKAKWDLLVYAGVNDVKKELNGKSSSSYLLRREKEEAPARLPFGGLQFSKSINNWDFRGGIEFAVVGEQVKYSPYSKGDYLNVYDDWIPNNYVVTDTDSAYIWGILFFNTTDYTVIDSVKVTVTDTLNGTYYNSNIRNANGTNRWYVMELPLEVLYQFRMKRWGIGVSAGIAPGMVVQSSGYYLKEDESGYTSIKKYNKQQFTLNARAGIELSYLLNTRCRLLLRPTTQYSVLKMDAGINEKQRYRRNGISLGLLYMIP